MLYVFTRLIQQNPAVDIGATSPLKLALNTAQYGRTFQDRSHIIQLSPRFTEAVPLDKNIYNLNIRGKRGNIVQVFITNREYFVVEEDYNPLLKPLSFWRNCICVRLNFYQLKFGFVDFSSAVLLWIILYKHDNCFIVEGQIIDYFLVEFFLPMRFIQLLSMTLSQTNWTLKKKLMLCTFNGQVRKTFSQQLT